MLQLQRPTRWLFDALGIVTGANPQYMREELAPVVETMQRGFSQALYQVGVFTGAAGTSVTRDLTYWPFSGSVSAADAVAFALEARFAHLARVSYYNLDSVNHTWTIVVQKAAAGSTGQNYLLHRTTVVAALDSWGELGYPSEWMFVPPGFQLMATAPQYTTTAGQLMWEAVRLPAGVSPP